MKGPYVYSRCCLALLSCLCVEQLLADNACCSFPCQNGGVCMKQGESYTCDCTNTEFSGKNCEDSSVWNIVKAAFKPSPDTTHYILTNYKWLWNIINNVNFLANIVMKKVYTSRSNFIDSPPTYRSDHSYITLDSYYNYSRYTRTLPPIPKDCPLPMGVYGKNQLPDVDVLVNKFFRRKKFIPEPNGSSVLFAYFAQHFVHQFFKTNFKKGPDFQWGQHGVDMSHVYGEDKAAQNMLRAFKDGKLKTHMINGEVYPPLLKDAPVSMIYPPNTPTNLRFGLGHKFYSLLPGLFMYAAIWLREHNRVCDILKVEHPEWDDERLFQTGRLILLGETIKIVIEDYVQHLSGYNFQLRFNPELLFGEQFQYQNRIAVEFNHLYHWHPFMPSEFYIKNNTYTLKDVMYRSDTVIKHGMHDFIDAVSKQRAGAFGPNNHDPETIPVAKKLIYHGRHLRLQPYNQYRKKFNMKPVRSFEELTGEKEMAKELEELYGDIDALEFYVGLVVEKRRPGSLFGGSTVEMGAPYSLKGLMSNPICSPNFWKPSTFGGDVGFKIVNTATLKKLFCANIEGKCPLVSFKVPNF